jgi:glycosyltransferase involved in cell wall biosynthesis
VLAAYRLHHGRTPHRLVVGGNDPERIRAEHAIPEGGYGSDIVFPGWVEQEDLPAVYSLADLFLYPSRLEAFPIPITEAMACGTPIVTSDANGLEEIAGDAALRVDPEDPGAISGAIQRVLTNPGLAAEMSVRGLERSKRFSWERCVRETLEILEGLDG